MIYNDRAKRQDILKTVQNHSLDVHLQFYPGKHEIKLCFPGKNAHLNRNLESISQLSYLQISPDIPTSNTYYL